MKRDYIQAFIQSIYQPYCGSFPLVLVDIGVSGGIQKTWKPAETYLHAIGFEPDPREFARLMRRRLEVNRRYINTALYKESAVIPFYLARKQECSSVFQPNRKFIDAFPEPERYDIIETRKIETDSLDSRAVKEGIKDIDFIKIDTQGCELAILEGAEKTLSGGIFGLEVEVEFAALYRGQPLFADIDNYIRNKGFQLFDLKPYYWKRSVGINHGKPKGQIIFGDALYFRDIDYFKQIFSGAETQDNRFIKSKILRAIVICMLYGYIDYAIEIFSETMPLFSSEERLRFNKAMNATISGSLQIPNFPGRKKLTRWIKRLLEILEKRQTSWSLSGKLGNLH